MVNFSRLLVLLAFVFAPLLGRGEIPTDTEVLSRIVSLAKPVHFNDTNGRNLVVPSGAYWVTPEQDSLLLFGVEDGKLYHLAATKDHGDTEAADPMAVSSPGSKNEPDVHYVVFMSDAGEQLVAKGSYSGVRSRGFLKEKLSKQGRRNILAATKRKIEGAKQAAKRRAQELRERVLQSAQEKIVSVALVPVIKNSMNVLEGGLSDAEKNAIRSWAVARFNRVPGVTNALLSIGERLAEVKGRLKNEVFFPVGLRRITPEEAWKRFVDLIGQQRINALKTELARSEGGVATRGTGNVSHDFLTFVVGLNESAAFLIGLQVPAGSLPSIAVGGLRDKDQHNFGFVWSGGGKLGISAEATGEITFSWFFGRPEDLSGGYIGYTMGGSTPTAVSVGLAISQYAAMKAIKDKKEGVDRGGAEGWLDANLLGQSVSVSAGVGIPVEASLVAGGTVALVPGKVLEFVRGL